MAVESTSRPSWLARREGRCRLLAALPLLMALSLIRDWLPALTALGLALLVAILGKVHIRWRGLIFSMLPVALLLPWTVRHGEILFETSPLTLTEGGVMFVIVFMLKTLAILLLVSALLASAPLPAHVVAARRLGLPNLFAHLLTLTWRYVFVLREEWARLRLALRVRGFRNRMNRHGRQTIGHVLGSILVRGHARAERVGQAMRCRGFDGQYRELAASAVKTPDWAMVLAAVMIAGGLIGWDVIR
ncbi:energy-coupling factor transporter transmembrane component T family protein [Zavarzinella formosa]|uniref:energy-coupling factor transporter transmembrane component T family protein n=1 Tax=Zavarzinella formosa TaxID=360055 RepID=UPI0002F85AE9|nr:energy-coupling factor transporter transmembrane component T [Zavarzinella formosa]